MQTKYSVQKRLDIGSMLDRQPDISLIARVGGARNDLEVRAMGEAHCASSRASDRGISGTWSRLWRGSVESSSGRLSPSWQRAAETTPGSTVRAGALL
jgi:hypothetical protein